MANDAEMGSWTDLLQSSSKLLEQAAPSAQFPPLQRNLDQLEALSKKLKAKTVRTEAPTQSIAATRLLAREGINAEQLARDLKSFELKAWSDTQREKERMANDAEMGSWTDLLHSSSKLLEQVAPSAQFPPLQRNLDQLEALSKKLKAKTIRTEAPTQSIAATRLLAREGINAELLARDLKSFELKVHEMAMVSAIQEGQKDNLRSFNDYTMTVLEAVGARLDQLTADVAELRTSVVADLTALRVEMQDHAQSIRGMMDDLFRVIDGRPHRRPDQLDDTPAQASPSQPRDA